MITSNIADFVLETVQWLLLRNTRVKRAFEAPALFEKRTFQCVSFASWMQHPRPDLHGRFASPVSTQQAMPNELRRPP